MNKEKMDNKEINLKHGYIFLTSILLVLFAISLSAEIYLKGGFNSVINAVETQISEGTNDSDEVEPTIELVSLKDGYKTKESSITVVAKTENQNKAWINGQEITVNEEGIFELQIDLIIGTNEVLIEVQNSNDASKSLAFSIIREEEKKEETKQDDKQEQPKTEIPKVEPKPETPKPVTPTEPIQPEPNPITGLKLSCSITNTQPLVGQSVSLDCSVKEQNNNPVNGATGNATMNWQSGQASYNFPSSSSGATKVNFTVPDGNSGSISGVVRISKDGLTVTSNFSIIVK
ncbi:MAG: hypothetical protein QY314_00440 [Candidatus Dojkabacteria bacterium]|nr:MAG: hypothetical protein QY314_00440 [Candidatus Dojkabacteria bacterium]